MKKLFFLLVIMLLSSSICFAYEIFSIHSENVNLTIDNYTLLGFGIFLVFCFLTIAIIIGIYISYINDKCLIKENSMEILEKLFVIGKIPYSQFGFMKKTLGNSNSDVSKQTNETLKQNGINAIPEKCSKTT